MRGALLASILMVAPVLGPLGAAPVPSAEEPTTQPGPLSEVTIVRDTKGVPHLYADSDQAVWYANGYVQARDRLFAMDVIRHVAYGTSATVLGPSQLPSDLAARRDLASRTSMARQTLNSSQELQDAARAFSEGVDHAVAEMTATGNLSAEFPLLNHAPEPWTPLDVAQVAIFLLDRFGTGGGGEIDNAKLLSHLQGRLGDQAGREAFSDLTWGINNRSYPTIPEATGTFDGPVPTPRDLDQLPADQAALLGPAARAEPFGLGGTRITAGQEPVLDSREIKWGSHALLVAPNRSETGEAMVGGGPQTGYFNPQVLYEVGLHGEEVDVTGVGVIGAPGVVLGRTADFAWTVTSGISDQVDIVGLEAVGDRSYRWSEETRQLDCRREVHVAVQPVALAVTGQPQAPEVVEQEVCEAEGGPVVAITRDDQGDPEWFWVQKKAHWGQDLVGAGLWLGLDDAKDLDDFEQAFEGFPFTFNFHYAGPEGACYFHVGTQPVRDGRLDPRLPTPGGPEWTWEGFLTGDEMPRACNPDQGYFANWNNLPQRGWPSGDTRELWGSVHRVERIDREVQQVLGDDADGKLSLADVKAIMERASTEDSLAHEIAPHLLAPDAAPEATTALAHWIDADTPWQDADGDGLYDHDGHTVYDRVLPVLLDEVFADELGDFARDVRLDPRNSSDPHAGDHGRHRNKFAILIDAMTGKTDRDWCDDLATPSTESCSDQLADAYAEANLTSGPVPATPVHLSPFTPIGAGPAYEIPMTNRATYYHFHVGPDTATSVSAIPPGQVGHLTVPQIVSGETPRHMDDQLQMYVDFAFKPVPFTLDQARDVAESEGTLVAPGV